MNLRYCKLCNHSHTSVERGHLYPQHIYCTLKTHGNFLDGNYFGNPIGIITRKKYKLLPDAEAPEGCPFVLEQLLDEK